jgi:phage replication O-like protein O
MNSPQLENGYTRIANELLDALIRYRIPGEERQVLDVIIRKTYAYGKKEDRISLSQFHDMTRIKKPGS